MYKLPLLEILDMSRNKLQRIPEEIKSLSSLRVFSMMQNRVQELPWSICDMKELSILKITENPLRFRLQRLIEQKEEELSKTINTNNTREMAVTVEIKKFLQEERRGYILATPVESESGGETSENTIDTPKPLKRVLSNRFPVIPSTSSGSGATSASTPSPESPAELTLKSPGSKPPPIPTKSHYRMQSGQSTSSASNNNYLRRPGASPLSGGSERNRSNSESVLQSTAPPRPTKRLALLRQEKPDLDTVEEGPSNRHSHLRGHSYASALRPRINEPTTESGSSGTESPYDGRSRRIPYIKRLSSLPEYKEETSSFNPLLEGAKGILYALYQVHPQISTLISVAKTGEMGRNSLDVLFYSASAHIEQLNEALDNAAAVEEEEDYKLENLESNIKAACIRCIKSSASLCVQLQQYVPKIIQGSDPRYVRTTMLLLYGSIVEIRNACTSVGFDLKPRMSMTKGSGDYSQISMGQTIRPARQQQERSLSRPGPRLRSDTTIHHPTLSSLSMQVSGPPLPTLTSYSQTANIPGGAANGMGFTSTSMNSNSTTGFSGTNLASRSRSNSRAAASVSSSVASTPRSGDTFIVPPPNGLANKISIVTGVSEAEEERLFEQIFIALTNAYDAALRSLPIARKHFQRSLESAEDGRLPKEIRDIWANLLYRCKTCLDLSEALHVRLINMKVKDPVSGRNQRDFWQLCKTFLQSFVELAIDMRDAKSMQVLTMESIVVLRPVQKASREASKLIDSSPWSFLTDNNINTSIPAINQFQGGAQNGLSPLSVALPATPLSAALGPAAQATIPSTPASAYGDQFFAGNVFQRADSLLSMSQAGGFPTYSRRS